MEKKTKDVITEEVEKAESHIRKFSEHLRCNVRVLMNGKHIVDEYFYYEDAKYEEFKRVIKPFVWLIKEISNRMISFLSRHDNSESLLEILNRHERGIEYLAHRLRSYEAFLEDVCNESIVRLGSPPKLMRNLLIIRKFTCSVRELTHMILCDYEGVIKATKVLHEDKMYEKYRKDEYDRIMKYTNIKM